MIQKKEIQIDLFQCDFCGSIFENKKSAEENGCTAKSLPDSIFKVGDKVFAKLLIGAGPTGVGEAITLCQVMEIKKPLSEDLTVSLIRFGGYNDKYLGFWAPVKKHDWIVRVSPLDKWYNEQKTEYFVEGWVTMSSLKTA